MILNLPLKFKQRTIKNFIIDFICSNKKIHSKKRNKPIVPNLKDNYLEFYNIIETHCKSFSNKSHGKIEDEALMRKVFTLVKEYIVEHKNPEIFKTIKKYKLGRLLVIFLFLAGFFSGFGFIFIRNIIDTYIFCFIVWDLCCISLWITLTIIIKELENSSDE